MSSWEFCLIENLTRQVSSKTAQLAADWIREPICRRQRPCYWMAGLTFLTWIFFNVFISSPTLLNTLMDLQAEGELLSRSSFHKSSWTTYDWIFFLGRGGGFPRHFYKIIKVCVFRAKNIGCLNTAAVFGECWLFQSGASQVSYRSIITFLISSFSHFPVKQKWAMIKQSTFKKRNLLLKREN